MTESKDSDLPKVFQQNMECFVLPLFLPPLELLCLPRKDEDFDREPFPWGVGRRWITAGRTTAGF